MRTFGVFVLSFAVFWTALVGLFDGMIGWAAWRQILAQDYATTEGVVTASTVLREPGSKGGSTWAPGIWYRYTVAGQTYENDTYRYGAGSSSDSGWAHKAVGDHPAGSAIVVHYDPASPSDSVLRTGLDGSDFFLALFLTPFTLVMFAMWWGGATMLLRGMRRARDPHAETDAVRCTQDGGKTRVHLAEIPPFGAGVAASGLAAFISIFIVAMPSGAHPPMGFILIMWALVIAAGVATFAWQWRAERRGDYDLVIDALAKCVDMPAMYGRKGREMLRAGEITAIELKTETRHGRGGGVREVQVIRIRRRDGRSETIAEKGDGESAMALAALLRAKMGFPPR